MYKSDSGHSFAKVLGQVYLCLESGAPAFTDFLDPERRQYAQSRLIGLEKFGIAMTEEGGYPEAERKMLGFAPEDMDFPQYPIARILAEFDAKHASPAHSDFLGAILGLGLSRNVIGDIVMLPASAVIMAEAHIEGFLLSGLRKVGKTAVSTSHLPRDAHIFGIDNRKTDRLICASLRLDNVLAAAFRLSRGDAAALVKSGKAFINWHEAASASKVVRQGDMLTLRKYGRVQISNLAGKSRKDHFLIDIIRY
ncbi:MAG: hypothetical protein LBE55_02685 [Clostridiales bacterium]|nr:hypothetical protein [Clostridiales bacterium]